MRTLTILHGDETKSVTDREIAEHYANSVCNQYGWGIRSAAWYELANPAPCSIGFLIKHLTSAMFPGWKYLMFETKNG